MDANGYFKITGRIKDMIIRGGENIYPKEIESVLTRHGAVLQAAVIGVPDDVKGEAIVGYAVAKPGFSIDPGAISATVAQVMGPAFRPREVIMVRELPKTQSGKIVRRLIRQRYLGEPLGDLSTVANPWALA